MTMVGRGKDRKRGGKERGEEMKRRERKREMMRKEEVSGGRKGT